MLYLWCEHKLTQGKGVIVTESSMLFTHLLMPSFKRDPKWREKLPTFSLPYDLVPKGVHENRTKGVENKVDDTLKLVVFLECAQC